MGMNFPKNNIVTECHRGKVMVTKEGAKYWLFNGVLHREDGPAVDHLDGRKSWFSDGDRHREDGPAIERPSGLNSWWVRGTYISKVECYGST